MSLARAIQRVTSEPAAFFGIQDRGVLAVGKAADLVIFDRGRNESGTKRRNDYGAGTNLLG